MIPYPTGTGVFITGAAGGIGRILIDAFLSAGGSVTTTYILDHGLDGLAVTYASDGVRTRVLDVSSSTYCQGAEDEAGHVDILINNAGASTGLIRDEHLNRSVDLDDVTPDFWDYFVGTNFFGPWCLIRACVPASGVGSLMSPLVSQL